MTIEGACDRIVAFLAARSQGATICPSEVARAMAAEAAPEADNWRDAMPTVHAAVDRLLSENCVQLSWKGKPLVVRAGPYRIRRVLRG